MNALVSRVSNWIEDRTGIRTICRRFFFEDIPASAGWPQVFGSVCLFLFLIQALTGVLLALNYAPTPGDAYTSLTYIIHKVAAGKMIRALHHWGASLLVIAVFLHMAQVFIYGAYKKPRETTWIVGITLLLLTLAFGLTGYLLPWDNRAYWGTVVTTRIMASAPVAGSFLTSLAGATNGVGVVTFSRFYALHTLLLPAATVFLISIHVYLVRRHGAAPAIGDTGPKQKFYPGQVFRDVVAVFLAFAILFSAAAFLDVPLERMADPTDTTYVPRPEWYFLFLFQLLKYFQGSLEVLATVIIPSLAVLVLVLLPFLNRVHTKVLNGRVQAAGVVLLVFSIWASLTGIAAWTTPHPTGSLPAKNLKPDSNTILETKGARTFATAGCAGCHKVNGVGGNVGPTLNGVVHRRNEQWVRDHFAAPQRLSPGTVMPPYHFAEADEKALIAYLFSLPD
jgi:ubiquinol-cytochrome c reductase cytochrome b subunit